MKKIIIFFLLLLIPTFLHSQVKDNNPNKCNFILHELNTSQIDYPSIENIEIMVNKNKQWIVNSLKIAIGNFRFIPSRYKKRFNATLNVNFKNNLSCKYNAFVRFSGDQKDHIDLNLSKNFINQSVDVSLKEGHINGITKFKLLLKSSRGKDEILLTKIFRELGYLAPRTNLIDVKINNVSPKMIFQEKARKELLEHSLRREGPLLEGDERFTYLLSQKVPRDQRSNYEAGLVDLLKTGYKSILAKQLNSKFILRNENSKLMSYDSLSNLNLIFLKYTNNFDKNSKYFESYRYYTLDNELLGFDKKKNILFLDIYNLLVMASRDGHSLAPGNRQFYWNAMENFFEPISYDGNFDIFLSPNLLIKPTSTYFLDSWDKLNVLLNNLDIKKLNEKVKNSGVKEDLAETERKISKLKNNLKVIKDKYLDEANVKKTSRTLKETDQKLNFNWQKLIKNTQKIESKVLFVKQDSNNLFDVCEDFFNCKQTNFSSTEITKLLDSDLIKDETIYQYIGKNFDSYTLLKTLKYKNIKFKKGEFYFTEGISFKFNNENKELNIYQLNPKGRVFLLNGILEDIKINFFGYKNVDINSYSNFVESDINGLTGCLSLVNVIAKNTSVYIKDSNCEDGINLINTEGTFNTIKVVNSSGDALDVDFSKVKIDNININNAKNDCADFSFGQYKINKLNLSNCGDKSLSVGEKSQMKIDSINVNNSNFGIASKDSSIVSFFEGNFDTVNYCLAAYNKKQEFFGGLIKFDNLQCNNYQVYFDVDLKSKILKKNMELN